MPGALRILVSALTCTLRILDREFSPEPEEPGKEAEDCLITA
jgi:hypothetical protein